VQEKRFSLLRKQRSENSLISLVEFSKNLEIKIISLHLGVCQRSPLVDQFKALAGN